MELEERILNLIIKEIDETISKEEVLALKEWQHLSDGNRQIYEEVRKLYFSSADILYLSPEDKEKDWLTIQSAIRKKKTSRFPTYWVAAASMAFIMLFSYLWAPLAIRTFNYEKYSAAADSVRISLPDGSLISLNKGGECYVSNDYGDTDRKILLFGEAYFDVAKNENKPFKIEVGPTEVMVLGTSFNLNEGDNGNIHLTLVEGRVQFSSKKNAVTLTEGESFKYLSETSGFEKTTYSENDLGWKTGKLTFQASPLEIVLNYISKMYQIPFQYDSEEIADLHLTTQFEKEKLEEVIQEIELVLPVKFSASENGYEIKTKP